MTINWHNLSSGEHDILLSTGAGKVEAKLHLPREDVIPEPPKAVAICCHPHPLFGGTMTNKVVHTIAKTFSQMGVPALRYNFRGVGKSEGTHDEGIGESKDLLELCDQVKASWPEQALWLAGFSFGSWVAARCANQAGASQLLSIAPPVQYFDVNNDMADCPWLVLMGEEDDVVDPIEVFNWVDTQHRPPKLIKFAGTGHFFHGQIVNMSKVLQAHYGPLVGYEPVP